MQLFTLVLAGLLVPALSAPTPEAGLAARGGEPQIHCEPPLVLEWNKCVHPKPAPAPEPIHCEKGYVYNEHEHKCTLKQCPKGMRLNLTGTGNCYNPAKHPSEDNCKYLGKIYNGHECVDKKPEPAPKPHCESKDEYYDEWAKKCLPIKKPTPPPIHCEHPLVLKDGKCVKPAPPPIHCEHPLVLKDGKCVKPAPPPIHCEHPLVLKDGKCVKPAPVPVKCPEHMRYNPKTMKCYNPARHPSEDNCKWLGLVYNAHEKKCEEAHKPTPHPKDCPKGMRYNPSTKKCYSPEKHPSEDNCAYLHKKYNKHENKCEDKH